MTEIYLIRHAQAEGNLYRVMQGRWDGGVTALGKEQIAALAERFKDVRIDAIYSSDLYRSYITAAGIQKYHPAPITRMKELSEIDIGPWQTRFFADVKREYPEEITSFFNDGSSFHLEGAEAYCDVAERGLRALTKIAGENEGKTVAAVSHGMTIRTTIAKILGIALSDRVNLPMFGNTGVTKLNYENGIFNIEYINDISHLAGLTPSWPKIGELWCEYIDPTKEKMFYIACYSDAWKCAHGTVTDFVASPYLRSAIRHHRSDGHAVMKLWEGDKPAGLVDLDPERGAEDGIGWVSLLYLKEEYRGKGYGAQVLARAIFFYRERGRRALRLNAAGDNIAALKFYERNGFKVIDVQKTKIGELLLLEKPLAEERNV